LPERFTMAASNVVAGQMKVSGLTSERAVAASDLAAPEGEPALPTLIRPDSQLIRTASMSLKVADVGRSLAAVTQLTDIELGDVVSLNDQIPASASDAHTASIEIRVPVTRFDATLSKLALLGNVRAQSVSAQDVSDQIVDGSARLRNLRRTESDMLGIMDRSGSIDQVLNVEQELSSVRDQIERLTAQLESVKNQVAFSTIDVTLYQPPVIAAPSHFRVLSDAWKTALAAVRDMTLGIASFCLWLIAFSPYLIVLSLVCLGLYRRVRQRGAAARL
jgi:hypothetical protein